MLYSLHPRPRRRMPLYKASRIIVAQLRYRVTRDETRRQRHVASLHSIPIVLLLQSKTERVRAIRLYSPTHERYSLTSAAFLSTIRCTSSPHTSTGRRRSPVLPIPRHSLWCFSASANSKTTQFSGTNGFKGSQRSSCGREGTLCGGTTERPRYKSSNTSATSSSSIGSLLNVKNGEYRVSESK